MNTLIENEHKRALSILKKHKKLLAKVAKELVKVETLEEAAFYKLIGKKPPKRREYDVTTKPVPAPAHTSAGSTSSPQADSRPTEKGEALASSPPSRSGRPSEAAAQTTTKNDPA